MSIKYTVSADGTFVHATATDTLTLEEIKNFINDTEDDTHIKPGFIELFDVRMISESQIDFQALMEIRELILASSKYINHSKLAIVVGKKSSFENAREYEQLVSPDTQNVIVFNNISTAKIWLGVTSEESW